MNGKQLVWLVGNSESQMNAKQRVWTNVMTASVNEALKRGLIVYPPVTDEPASTPEGATFDIEIAGLRGRACVRAIYFDNILVGVILDGDEHALTFAGCANLASIRKSLKAGVAATGWLERKNGFHLQTARQGGFMGRFSCANRHKNRTLRKAGERAVFKSSQEEAQQDAYRQGFYSGVSAVISGVFEKLSKEDVKKVEDWLKDALVSWRDNGGGEPAPNFPMLDQDA